MSHGGQTLTYKGSSNQFLFFKMLQLTAHLKNRKQSVGKKIYIHFPYSIYLIGTTITVSYSFSFCKFMYSLIHKTPSVQELIQFVNWQVEHVYLGKTVKSNDTLKYCPPVRLSVTYRGIFDQENEVETIHTRQVLGVLRCQRLKF